MKATKSGIFTYPVFRAKGGETLDGMAEKLVEEGYLLERDPVKLMDMIGRSLSGERVHSPNVGDAVLEEMEQRHRGKYGDEDIADASREEIEVLAAAMAAPEIISSNTALNALATEAESLGIDIEGLAEQASKETEDGTQRDYEVNYSAKLKTAIEATRAGQGDLEHHVAGSARAGQTNAQESLFAGPTAAETRQAGVEGRRRDIEGRNARQDVSLTGHEDLFDTGAATGQTELDVSRGAGREMASVVSAIGEQAKAVTQLAESVSKIAEALAKPAEETKEAAPPSAETVTSQPKGDASPQLREKPQEASVKGHL
jgi:hypothetical protein